MGRVNEKENELVSRSASSLTLAIAITVLYSAVCAVGLLGNVLVMFGIVW